MCLDHIEVEAGNPIEKRLIGSKIDCLFRLVVQDLPDRCGCFCHVSNLLSINLLYYLERSIFKSVTLKYPIKYDRMRKKSAKSSANRLRAKATTPIYSDFNPVACGELKPFLCHYLNLYS
jgi:hypothetical protein